MQDNRLIQFIDGLFSDSLFDDNLTLIKKEISAMRNSQPPAEPTFVLGQTLLKGLVKQKINDSTVDHVFNHVVITGDVGDGKSHFLNRIESYFGTNKQFFVVKNRAEESSAVGHSFIKMVVNTIFKKYYEDFCDAMLNANQVVYQIKTELGDNCPDAEVSNRMASKLNISNKVGHVLYEYKQNQTLRYPALNILGGNEFSSDLTKLKILKLSNEEYLEIIKIFMENIKAKGSLIIILDEFEHAFTAFTPAAKRNFLVSYKIFIDHMAQSSNWPIVLFTAITEQYEGSIKKAIGELDQALWSRIEHNRFSINRFNITKLDEFTEIFTALASRYLLAHSYDIGFNGVQEMRKRMFSHWGEQFSRKNREIISLMLKIMDDLRSTNTKLTPTDEENEEQLILEDKSTLKKEYNEKIQWVADEFNKAYHTGQPGMIKSGVEELVKITGGQSIDIGKIKAKGSRLFFSTKDKVQKFLCIAYGKNITKKFKDCEDAVTELKQRGLIFKSYFMYIGDEDISVYLKQNPDIFPIALNTEELYSIVALSLLNESDKLRNIFVENLADVKRKLS